VLRGYFYKKLNYIKIISTALWLVAALALAACTTPPRRNADEGPVSEADPPVVVYVIKRSWHTDIGFNVADLQPPLSSLRPALPDARYFLFGFGDKHYLLGHAGSFDRLFGAVWPGDGMVLLTGLEATPEEAFGAAEVTRLTVSAAQARKLEGFVWNTLAKTDGAATSLAPGPYSGSLYYGAAVRYSGLHTCNTWTAEALQTAGLPVRSFGVEFSGQVWRQVRRIKEDEEADQRGAPAQKAPTGDGAPQASASRP
jgi:uncharacterized protein (TIGR02117 family)